MKKEEFKNLKVGKSIYFPSKVRGTKFISAEITDIDRLFGKLKGISMSKPISYRFCKIKLNDTKDKCTGYCGIVKDYKPYFIHDF